MEYKINQFNLSDINFPDLKALISYFDISIPRQKISSIYLGPNLLHFSTSNKKLKKSTEDKKLISTFAHLITSTVTPKNEQNCLLFSTSNDQTKIFLKRLVKEIGASLQIKSNTNQQKENNQNEIEHIISFYNFLSYFTAFKDDKNEEIPLTDFMITLSVDKGLEYCEMFPFQFNHEMLLIKMNQKSQMINMNNVHFFYMLLYNLPQKELEEYLLCKEIENNFQIFSNNNSTDDLEEFAKRYVFVNQFSVIKNDLQYNMFSKMEENAKVIKQEYLYYKEKYDEYNKIKNYLMISDNIDKNIKGIFLGLLLLNEFDIYEDDIYKQIQLKQKANYSNSSIDLFTMIRNVVINDERFLYLKEKDQNAQRTKSEHILSKIALCLGMSEDKIIYSLLTTQSKSSKGKIVTSKAEVSKNFEQLSYILFQIGIDKVLNVFQGYTKQKKLTQSTSNCKVNLIISRSNLVHELTYNTFSLTDNPYFTISNNIIDSNSFIISSNVKEYVISNYLQELKNYSYLSHALTITKTKSKLNYNDDYVNKIFRENFAFDAVMNLYENSVCGLLKTIEDPDEKYANNLSIFKTVFENTVTKKGVIELVEVFNCELQIYQTYIKVKHSFGTFLYDLSSLIKKEKNLAKKEHQIFKFLEYKPVSYNEDFFNHNLQYSLSIMKKLLNSPSIYIALLIQLNKYNILTLIDDLKLNNIYYYYSNFFNYVVNVKKMKENLLQIDNAKFIQQSKKDDFSFFKFLSRKIRISIKDYYFENGNIFARSKLSNAFEENRNIASVLFKYNYELFNYLLCDRIAKSKFNYFLFAINGVRAFVKLTKIYHEKRVLSNVRNLLTDVIVDNYDVLDDQNNLHFNNDVLPKIDKLSELTFDFNKETLSKVLPKLRSNLAQLKRLWKNYVSDINYLESNKKMFANQECTQLVIEQRLINFQILLFLFSKHYKFINRESVKKFGVLVTEFTKTVSDEVLNMLNELYVEFQDFLRENNLNISNLDNINFEKLIMKRIEIQQISRKNSLMAQEEGNKKEVKEFNIPVKELNECKSINHNKSRSGNSSINSNINSIRDLKCDLSFKKLESSNSIPLSKRSNTKEKESSGDSQNIRQSGETFKNSSGHSLKAGESSQSAPQNSFSLGKSKGNTNTNSVGNTLPNAPGQGNLPLPPPVPAQRKSKNNLTQDKSNETQSDKNSNGNQSSFLKDDPFKALENRRKLSKGSSKKFNKFLNVGEGAIDNNNQIENDKGNQNKKEREPYEVQSGGEVENLHPKNLVIEEHPVWNKTKSGVQVQPQKIEEKIIKIPKNYERNQSPRERKSLQEKVTEDTQQIPKDEEVKSKRSIISNAKADVQEVIKKTLSQRSSSQGSIDKESKESLKKPVNNPLKEESIKSEKISNKSNEELPQLSEIIKENQPQKLISQSREEEIDEPLIKEPLDSQKYSPKDTRKDSFKKDNEEENEEEESEIYDNIYNTNSVPGSSEKKKTEENLYYCTYPFDNELNIPMIKEVEPELREKILNHLNERAKEEDLLKQNQIVKPEENSFPQPIKESEKVRSSKNNLRKDEDIPDDKFKVSDDRKSLSIKEEEKPNRASKKIDNSDRLKNSQKSGSSSIESERRKSNESQKSKKSSDRKSVDSQKDKTSLENSKPKKSTESPKEKKSIENQKDKTSIENSKPKKSTEIPKEKKSIESQRDKISVENSKPKKSIEIPKEKKSIEEQKDKISVESSKPKKSIEIPKEKSPIENQKDKTSIESSKPKKSIEIPKEKSSIESQKDKKSIDKERKSIDSSKESKREKILNESQEDKKSDKNIIDNKKGNTSIKDEKGEEKKKTNELEEGQGIQGKQKSKNSSEQLTETNEEIANEKDNKNSEKYGLPSLKELDQKIAQLKKELNALDIMDNLTEQTSLLFYNKEEESEQEMLKEAKKINKDFYDEIEAKLQMAEEAVNIHFQQS